MVRLSRVTDYAARLVVHLACLPPGEHATIAEIAETRALPVAYVRRLISRLVEAGLVKTIRGKAGGVALARKPASISLLDVIHAVEGPLALNHCLEEEHSCPFSGQCPVQVAWEGATKALEDYLSSQRFDALSGSTTSHTRAHLRAHRGARRASRKE